MNHPGIYKKYYPAAEGQNHDQHAPEDADGWSPSPAVLTFRNVLRFLAERAGMIERLSLKNTALDGTAVQDMCK